MNLINLKDAPLVEKAEEGATLFTLNPDGTINRISAENVGGSGSGSPRFIRFNVAYSDYNAEPESAAVELTARTVGQTARPRAAIEDVLGAVKDGAKVGAGVVITCDTDANTVIEYLNNGDRMIALLEIGEATSVDYGFAVITEQYQSVSTYMAGDDVEGGGLPWFSFCYFGTYFEIFWDGEDWAVNA